MPLWQHERALVCTSHYARGFIAFVKHEKRQYTCDELKPQPRSRRRVFKESQLKKYDLMLMPNNVHIQEECNKPQRGCCCKGRLVHHSILKQFLQNSKSDNLLRAKLITLHHQVPYLGRVYWTFKPWETHFAPVSATT